MCCCKFFLGFLIFFSASLAQAGKAMWAVNLIGSAQITIPQGGTNVIKYRVINQTKAFRTLVMRAIPGITQNTTQGNCSNPIRLSAGGSCILNLNIVGTNLRSSVFAGPVICQSGSSMCYQPTAAASLKITKKGIIRSLGGTVSSLNGQLTIKNATNTLVIRNNGSFVFPVKVAQGASYAVSIIGQPSTQTCSLSNSNGVIGAVDVTNIGITCQDNTYTISGLTSGLLGTLVLQNNGGDDVTLTADGAFTFSTPILQGSNYNITVAQQPNDGTTAQTCSVNHGSGTMGSNNINTVSIICSANDYQVGGTVTGLAPGASVDLSNNGDPLTVVQNGAFSFSQSVASGAGYSVSVVNNPTNPTQTCTIDSTGTGTVSTHDVTNVAVVCSTNSYFLGGQVSGLGAGNSLTLKNNGQNDLAVSADGSFQFTDKVASGAAYLVTAEVTTGVSSTPQVCSLQADSGTMGSADVNAVQIDCVDDVTTMSANLVSNTSNPIPTLKMALSVKDLTSAYLTGKTRVITITNTGQGTLVGLTITPPVGFTSATFQSHCGSSLAPGASCTYDIIPGTTATSNCTMGIAPTPGSITISASNSSSITAEVLVLGYGCIYQGGYLYAIDDTIADNKSISGYVVTTTAQSTAVHPGVIWSSSGIFDSVDYTNLGITQNSTSPCNSKADGKCNTQVILDYYSPVSTYPLTNYAAGLCTGSISGYSDWYLPALCEMGYDGEGNGTGCGSVNSPLMQNMYTNLVANHNPALLSGLFVSSTQALHNPATKMWYEVFDAISTQGIGDKANAFNVLCARSFSD